MLKIKGGKIDNLILHAKILSWGSNHCTLSLKELYMSVLFFVDIFLSLQTVFTQRHTSTSLGYKNSCYFQFDRSLLNEKRTYFEGKESIWIKVNSYKKNANDIYRISPIFFFLFSPTKKTKEGFYVFDIHRHLTIED